MNHIIHFLVQENGWIHTGIGLTGNFAFFFGSVLFLPAFEPLKTFGVYLFLTGSFLMLIGTLGNLAVELIKKHRNAAQKPKR